MSTDCNIIYVIKVELTERGYEFLVFCNNVVEDCSSGMSCCVLLFSSSRVEKFILLGLSDP
jgi:hypothetical protein